MYRGKTLTLLCLFVSLVSCTHGGPQFPGKTEGEKLNNFLQWSFVSFLDHYPEVMTELGIDKKQDELNQYSFAFDQKIYEQSKKHLSVLHDFDRDTPNLEECG